MSNNFLRILYEDDSILAIDKPSGLPSNSLVNSLESCESVLKEMRPKDSFLLTHRLDTGTSGVLIFAKNESAFNGMREQFQLKKVKKQYLAWAEKLPSRTSPFQKLMLPLSIELPLAHHAKSKKRMIAVKPSDRHFRGKPIPAFTILHVAREEIFLGIPAYRFQVEIVTGVMHQIRVHLSDLGFPLIGDTTYPNKISSEGAMRLGLHAEQICFNLNGFRYELESPWSAGLP